MRRWIALAIIAVLSVTTVGSLVYVPSLLAGAPESRVTIVETNLTIGPGMRVFSQAVSLDGFARWAFQITVRSGFPLNFDWRPVYRFRSDLDWSPSDPAFTIDTFQTHQVVAPEAAIEFRNAGAGTIRVAISASMYRHHVGFGAYNVTGSGQVLVGSNAIQIAPGQSQFSDEFNVGSGNMVFYQLQLDSGELAMGQVVTDTQWRIFSPQDWELNGTAGAISDRRIGGPHEAQSSHTRLRITNNSPEFVEVRVAAYVITVQ